MNEPHYESRRNRLQRKFREAGIDSLLVTGLANVRYLTGFTGDSSWLFLSLSSHPVMLSDTRYETQLSYECPGLNVEIRDAGGTLPALFAKVAAAARVRRAGFETDHVTVSQYGLLSAISRLQKPHPLSSQAHPDWLNVCER